MMKMAFNWNSNTIIINGRIVQLNRGMSFVEVAVLINAAKSIRAKLNSRGCSLSIIF